MKKINILIIVATSVIIGCKKKKSTTPTSVEHTAICQCLVVKNTNLVNDTGLVLTPSKVNQTKCNSYEYNRSITGPIEFGTETKTCELK